jgi:hypothetical protein
MKRWILLAITFAGFALAHAQTKPVALLLFGGEGHKVFLGCLNCADTSEVSVCNEYGKYGSQYESQSIWNVYGTFGSHYNSVSPWNEYSNSAPIIVDKDGKSYGYFTANSYHHDRTKISWLVRALNLEAKSHERAATRALICSDD